ncbi:MAG: glycosyltransferase [Candidatus Sumerlaeaceae bacterium]|nr:glycosyltransferase [Candidatus Sumerlaeaceae bacterium]
MNPKILYLAPGNPVDGAPHPFMPAYWLRSRGYDIQILCQSDRGAFEERTVLGIVQVRGLPGQGIRFQAGLVRELFRQRSRRRSDMVFYVHGHVVTPAANFALVGVPRQRIIYHTQDFIEPGRHPHWELFERRFARRAGWVISNEVNRARALMSCYGLKQMPNVVPTALPRNWPRPDRNPELRKKILARVGRQDVENCRLIMHEGGFAPIRCGRQLVEAFRLLREDFLLVFTGMRDGSEARLALQRVAKELGLEKRILVLERLDFPDLMLHTACCDAGILLYPNDGIGNFYQCPGRLTHYLGCGLPIIASNFPGLELLTLKHNLGAVCDPQSPAAIAAAIQAVAGRKRSDLDSHAAKLKQLARGELAYETHAGPIEDILKSAGAATTL